MSIKSAKFLGSYLFIIISLINHFTIARETFLKPICVCLPKELIELLFQRSCLVSSQQISCVYRIILCGHRFSAFSYFCSCISHADAKCRFLMIQVFLCPGFRSHPYREWECLVRANSTVIPDSPNLFQKFQKRFREKNLPKQYHALNTLFRLLYTPKL